MSVLSVLISQLSDGSSDVYMAPSGWIGVHKAPDFGSHAYLHLLFPPLERELADAVEKRSGVPIPDHVRDFLSEINGAILFQGELSLYGIRTSLSRNVLERQPFDIFEPNSISRPREARLGDFYIGSYSDDGSRLLVKGEESTVHRCERATGRVLGEWRSIQEMLAEEVPRIMTSHSCQD